MNNRIFASVGSAYWHVCLAALLCGWGTLGAINQADAMHPGHVSLAEVEWNPRTGNFEVALCVSPFDLEQALSQQEKKPIQLDKAENLDVLLEAYISQRFAIRPPKTQRAQRAEESPHEGGTPAPPRVPMRWVGHEINLKHAWLYFEVSGDTKVGEWEIENRVFFGLVDQQSNCICLTVGKRKQWLTLTEKNGVASFSTRPAPPAPPSSEETQSLDEHPAAQASRSTQANRSVPTPAEAGDSDRRRETP